MSVGGQMGSQKGYQNNNQSGQTSGTTAGTMTGATTGSMNGSTTVDPTAGYSAMSGQLQGLLGQNGMTPEQAAALHSATANMNANPGGNISGASSFLQNYVGGNHPAYSIAGAPQVGTGTVTTGPVIAGDIASMIDRFQNPYTQQVVDATTADAQHALGTNLNEIAAQYGGQYGNGRAGVAMGQAVGDSTRALASTLGQLRKEGYGTALAGATTQAGNNLSASGANAANSLTASGENAANTLSASGQNAGNALTAQQVNVGQRNINDQTSMQAIRDYISGQTTGSNVANSNAQTVAGIGGGGVNQMLQFLGSQVPAFGSNTSGNTSGTTSGSTSGSTTGQMSGQSSGNSGGSSKGGGMSVPLFG